MKIWQLINFDCIYCQNFSMKTKFILGFLFIMITLVGLYNIHVLNYTRNIFKKLHTKHQKTFSNSFSRSLSNTKKWDNFLKNTLWKMNHFRKTLMLKQTKCKTTTLLNIINITTHFEKLTIRLHILYALNTHVKFCVNRILFTIWFIRLYFMHNFKLQKLAI